MGDAPWDVKLFVRHPDDDPACSCPAEEFLNQIPDSVATDFIAIIDDVAAAPPPRFSGGGHWEAMHGAMRGFYEARVTGPQRRQYRLFCILERSAPGLDGPTIVLICGLEKKHREVFSESDYAWVRRLGAEYRSRVPRSVG